MRKLVCLALVLLLFAAPAIADTVIVVPKGFDVFAKFTLPVAPGGTAVKQNLLVADDVPTYFEAERIRDSTAALLDRMALSLNPPPRGYNPFVHGTEIRPEYVTFTVPDQAGSQ